jgi:tetratricopeptide (TPR) repeat protein
MQRFRWVCGAWVAWCLLINCGQAAAARLYLESPPNLNSNNRYAPLILRELPRQAILIAVARDCRVLAVDPTVEPDAVAANGDIKLRVATSGQIGRYTLKLHDASGAELASTAISVTTIRSGGPAVASFAEKVDEVVNGAWAPIIAGQLGSERKEPAWNAELPAPPECVRLLKTVDFQNAFLAARLTERAIAETGESPERLAVLVRAYAHLGEATRHLINGQSSAFFARSLLYAQRLIRLAPEGAESWWCRAYAQTLYGFHLAAEADLKTADDLAAGKPAPGWVGVMRGLLEFDTSGIQANANDRDAALASYFMWLSIVDSDLPGVNIRFSRLAMDLNPGAIRVFSALTDYGGVSLQHQTTVEASRVLNRLIASLADEPAAEESVRASVGRARDMQFAQNAVVALLDGLEREPRNQGELMPWTTYVAIVRDAQFVNAVQRLDFMTYSWSVDPTAEARDWLKLLSKHRYAPFIQSFEKNVAPAALEKARHLPLKDDGVGAEILTDHLRTGLRLSNDPQTSENWNTRQFSQMDRSAYNFVHQIWLFSGSRNDQAYAEHRAGMATLLEDVSPRHPLIMAARLGNGAADLNELMKQIQPEQRKHPTIAFALGKALVRENRSAEALPLLESVVELSPDIRAYHALAEAHWMGGDQQGWLKTLQRFLADGTDYGLDFASVNDEIARYYIGNRDFTSALSYARDAAQSFSAWGLSTYGIALTETGNYDEAGQVFFAMCERYNTWPAAYRWSRLTGRGDKALAARMYRQWLKEKDDGTDSDVVLDTASFYLIEKDAARAGELANKALAMTPDDPYTLTTAAMLLLDCGDKTAALQALERAAKQPADTVRLRAYVSAAAEAARCLADGKAAPNRPAEVEAAQKDRQIPQVATNTCYVLGRVAEANGQTEAAKAFYRSAVTIGYNDPIFRPFAAEGLRRLGEEPFK